MTVPLALDAADCTHPSHATRVLTMDSTSDGRFVVTYEMLAFR